MHPISAERVRERERGRGEDQDQDAVLEDKTASSDNENRGVTLPRFQADLCI